MVSIEPATPASFRKAPAPTSTLLPLGMCSLPVTTPVCKTVLAPVTTMLPVKLLVVPSKTVRLPPAMVSVPTFPVI